MVRAKKKKTALANMVEGIGLVEIIKMTGRKKAPGPKMKDWSGRERRMGRVLALLAWRNPLLGGGFYIPQDTESGRPIAVSRSPALCGRAFHRSVGKLLVDGEPQTLRCTASDRGPLLVSEVPLCGEFILHKELG